MLKPDPKNATTLEAYENNLEAYISAGIPQTIGTVKDWIDSALALLPANAHVFEIGSAYGRDAQYIEDKGFRIDRTDAAKSFVDFMKSKGKQARLFDALTGDYPSGIDMIYANAVLLHFDDEQTKLVLKQVHDSLRPQGYFAFSVKIGEGENWSRSKLGMPRYFNYWDEEPLRKLLHETKFEPVYFEHGNTGHDNGEWFHLIAQGA